MDSFGYQAVEAIVTAEVSMQLKRAGAREEEVLNVPIILGGVGVGKTSIARSVAKKLGCPLIRINCGECGDPSEFGMPVPFRIKTDANEEPYMPWVLNRALHIACTEGVVLFFDDIDKAPALVEGSLLSIFGERSCRDRVLHDETVVIAAGNRIQDDSLARRLSESMRTRGTIINLEPRFTDFAAYAKKNPTKVHPTILGFLAYRKSMLHVHDDSLDRFPTPRGWVEASAYLYAFDVDFDIAGNKTSRAWKTMIGLKCGDAAANDFSAWYEVVSRVDVKKLLRTGELEHSLADKADEAIVHYAAVFAVAQHLNSEGAKKEHVGLLPYLTNLHPEHRVALLTHLSHAARAKTAKVLPDTASYLLADIVPLGD